MSQCYIVTDLCRTSVYIAPNRIRVETMRVLDVFFTSSACCIWSGITPLCALSIFKCNNRPAVS